MTAYDNIKALNFSSLKHLAKSPLHYRYRVDHPEPRKTDFVIGCAFHCLVLEPDQFDSRYAECDVTRNKKHAAYQAWLSEHKGAESLKPAEISLVRAMGEAVKSHKVAAGILDGCRKEEPLTWQDPTTGMLAKGRLDGVRPERIVDLKSTRSVVPFWFARDAARFMYHAQLSWYQTGAVATKKIDGAEMPQLIAVEKDPPHDVAVYVFKPDDLAAGRALCVRLMHRLQECSAAEWWPGVAPDLQYLDLPPWTAGADGAEEEEGF